MKVFLTVILSVFSSFVFSQIWNISNQNCIGGTDVENIGSSLTLSNGNHLIFGSSQSGISGNKIDANIGGVDLWIVVIDDNLQIVWQKTIGGLLDDNPTKVIETSDHNLLFVSNSLSQAGGLKTAPNHGVVDIWLIKTDLNGTIIWDKSYGGDQIDLAGNIIELESGNFVIFGESTSGITGNKTSANIGATDGWFIKIDKQGNILSDKSFGGTNDDYSSYGMVLKNDHIFVSLHSNSNISGNKTENSYGQNDFWICKLDTNGSVILDKTIGGTGIESMSNLVETTDGNFLISGSSNSPISGVKTENCFNNSYDCWIIKFDAELNLLNQKTIGGDAADMFNFSINSGSHYLVGCVSYSNISGFKSENSIGSGDNWFFTIDENLNFINDKTIGSTQLDSPNSALFTGNSGYIIISTSNGSNTGNKTCPGYNTGSSNSPMDFWVYNLQTDLGIKEINKVNELLFPNPVSESFKINSEEQITIVTIQTLEGKIITQFEGKDNMKSFDVNYLTSGIYLCKIHYINGTDSIIRFIKE